jgi:hypothetical protein
MPPSGSGANDGYGVYRLIIARLDADPRQPDNVRGEVFPGAGAVWSVVAGFRPEPGAPAPAVDPSVILPADVANAYGFFGPEGENKGFYVLGPRLDPTTEASPFGPLETLRRSEMSYLIPAANPLLGQLPRPSFLLQRLACPHLPPNPAPGQLFVDPSRPYNPYITVDYVRNVQPNYAASTGVLAVDPAQQPQPNPVPVRTSWGRKQPYAANVAHQQPQQPLPPLPGQPQHTFFQHNADQGTPGPNWRTPPAGYPPFNWLVHLDRRLASPMELLHVSAYKPHELTQEFINPVGSLGPFNHRAPWFDEDLAGTSPPQSHRLYRAFEFFETRQENVGLPAAATYSPAPLLAPGASQLVAPAAMVGVTATGGLWRIEAGSSLVIDRGQPTEEVVRVKAVAPPGRPIQFLADFLRPHGANFTIAPTVVSERTLGKINLNTVWDEETFQALCDAQPSNRFNPADVAAIFRRLKASRTVGGETPGPGDRPFRSLATGAVPPGDTQFPGAGIEDTILRSAAPNQPPLLTLQGGSHPRQDYELLTKIFNNVTVRSNVFAVWVTVGFFEVTDDTTRPVKLGAEFRRSEGRHVRHRMFAIVDRSVLLLNPGPQPRFDPRAIRSPGSASGRVAPYLSIID